MFMQIVTQVLGRLMARCLTVYTSVKELLFTLVSKLRVSITQVYQSVVNLQILNLLAKIKSSIKPYLAHLIIQAQLMKLGLMNVLHKVGALGQQLLTTVRQILQRVLSLLKRGN
jgi:phage-related protein